MHECTDTEIDNFVCMFNFQLCVSIYSSEYNGYARHLIEKRESTKKIK